MTQPTPSPVLSAELKEKIKTLHVGILELSGVDVKLSNLHEIIAHAVSEAVNDKLSSIEIELDKAYPKDGNIPKRSVLFLMANGKAEELLSERKESV